MICPTTVATGVTTPSPTDSLARSSLAHPSRAFEPQFAHAHCGSARATAPGDLFEMIPPSRAIIRTRAPILIHPRPSNGSNAQTTGSPRFLASGDSSHRMEGADRERTEAGFKVRTPVDEARRILQEALEGSGDADSDDVPCGTVDVDVDRADGRVLAAPVASARDVPHYRRAAMDGYAVRAADTFGASDRSPEVLRITEPAVSSDDEHATADRIEPGTAARVHTGSALPEGANAVVVIERVTELESAGELEVGDAVAEGENVAPVGEDVERASTCTTPATGPTVRSGTPAIGGLRPRRGGPAAPGGRRADGRGTRRGRPRSRRGRRNQRAHRLAAGPALGRSSHRPRRGHRRSRVASRGDPAGSDEGRDRHDRRLLGRRARPPPGSDRRSGERCSSTASGSNPATPSVSESSRTLPCSRCRATPSPARQRRPVPPTDPALARGDDGRSPSNTRATLERKIPSEPGGAGRSRGFGSRRATRTRVIGSVTNPSTRRFRRARAVRVLSSVALADGCWVVVDDDREGIPAGETVAVENWEPNVIRDADEERDHTAEAPLCGASTCRDATARGRPSRSADGPSPKRLPNCVSQRVHAGDVLVRAVANAVRHVREADIFLGSAQPTLLPRPAWPTCSGESE